MAGSIKKQYQVLLLKKFLNYAATSRSQIQTEQLLMGMVRDVSSSVVDGYVAALNLVFGTIFKIGYLVTATIYIGMTAPTGLKMVPIIAVLTLPLFIGVFLWARRGEIFRLRENQFATENESLKYVILTVMNYQIIAVVYIFFFKTSFRVILLCLFSLT